MKRFIAIIVCLIMIPTLCIASDLSDMAFDDLIELNRKIVAEIISRPEWKEVSVPSGTWKIGEDIPEGKYSIKTKSILTTISIWSKEPGDYDGYVDMKIISQDDGIGKIELKAGWTIELTTSVIFAPPVSLGF